MISLGSANARVPPTSSQPLWRDRHTVLDLDGSEVFREQAARDRRAGDVHAPVAEVADQSPRIPVQGGERHDALDLDAVGVLEANELAPVAGLSERVRGVAGAAENLEPLRDPVPPVVLALSPEAGLGQAELCVFVFGVAVGLALDLSARLHGGRDRLPHDLATGLGRMPACAVDQIVEVLDALRRPRDPRLDATRRQGRKDLVQRLLVRAAVVLGKQDELGHGVWQIETAEAARPQGAKPG